MAAWARYRDLLGQLGPSGMVDFAWRRTYRAVQQRRGPNVLRMPANAQLLSMLDSGRPHAWCDSSQRDSVLSALTQLPGARERAESRAQAALARRYDVFGTCVTVEGSAPTPWSVDPVSGHSYPDGPARTLKIRVPGSDPKFPWALGRLDAAVALSQGAWVADTEAERDAYVTALVALWRDFSAGNPVGRGIQWNCPMEVALRAANLAQALRRVGEAPQIREPVFLRHALTSLAEHAAYVETHLEDGWRVPNNHLVSNYAGLATVAALFPGLPRSGVQLSLALRGLTQVMQTQVHPDGMSFEGSVPYHRLSVELFTLGLLAADAAQRPLDSAYRLGLQRMFGVARAYCSESGGAPQMGDNDSGRAWPLADRPSLDHGYLAPLGAALLGAGGLKTQGDVFPDEAAWLLGRQGLTRFQGLSCSARPRVFSSSNGGLHVARGAGMTLSLSAGPMGQRGVGGHNHNDQLSFELHYEGRPLVVDVGTGTYTREGALRNHFRSTASHNTVVVDGREQSELGAMDLFRLIDRAQGRLDEISSTPSSVHLTASHRAHAKGAAPVTVARTWALEGKDSALVILDALEGFGTHDFQSRFHLAPDVTAELVPLDEATRSRVHALHNAPFELGPTGVKLSRAGRTEAHVVFDIQARVSLEVARYSPSYGEIVDTRVILLTWRSAVPQRLASVFLFDQPPAS